MVIIVGLGNPDAKYAHTYHNLGFDAVDLLAKNLGIEISKSKFKALVGEGVYNGEKILLLKPQTYMNLSGESVVMAKQKFSDARIIVLVDDIDLPKGTVRYRERGSAGTHNGLRNIVAHIGQEFERVKIGAGRDVTVDLVDYVLSKYDEKTYQPILQKAVDVVLERI